MRPIPPPLFSTLLVAAGALGSACADAIPAEGPPNLILISLDTCRRDRLSCYGSGSTPNLDAFAAEAVRFGDCQTQSGLTGPSHLSMLTGQFVHRHGLEENGQSRRPAHSLASVLTQRGWRTAAFTGHGFFQEEYGHATGFQTFESWIGEPPTDYPFWRDVAEVVPSAVRWLDENAGADGSGQPFFLVVHGYDPHQPYYPPPQWRERFAGWYEGDLDTSMMRSPQYRRKLRKGRLSAEDLRYVNDLYDAEVACADDVLGGFLEELRKRDLLDRSIVVFTSDHGEALGNRNHIGHGAVVQDVLEVPLLVRFPGGRWAGTLEGPVMTIDLAPTLLAALDVPPPPGMQGENLMPWIRGQAAAPGEDRMRVSQTKQTFAVRFGPRWKIVALLGAGDDNVAREAIYDLEADPREAENLYESEEGRKRFNELMRRFLDWRAQTYHEDERFRAVVQRTSDPEADRRLLEALGYAGEGGDDGEAPGDAPYGDGTYDDYEDYDGR